MKFKEENFRERLEFIDKWSKFVLENEDKVWSRQQNIIINSCLRSTEISKEDYLKLKEKS
jgi:hypothetical protein